MATRELEMQGSSPNIGPTEQKGRIRIFILVDALGWRYIEGKEFLGREMHYRKPLRTILGFSSGAIPAILTGVPPEQNGHWNLFYYDPQNSPFRWIKYFSFLPDRILDHRVTRKIVKELGRGVFGMGPMFECYVSPRLLPWFNFIERKCIYTPEAITGAPSIFDRLVSAGVPYRSYSYHSATDADIVAQAKKDIAAGEAGFFFLYLSEMDAFLHAHCRATEEIDQKLAWYEQQILDVMATARRVDPHARFALFSDHGMTPVQRHYDLVREMTASRFRMPQDYLTVYDSTMARYWFFNEDCRREFESKLRACPAGRILREEELREFGVYFPDHRYGELIFLLHPGWLIAKSDFNGKGWSPVGMHGYHPDDSYSDGVFLANYLPEESMHSVVDVFSTMNAALQDLRAPGTTP